MSTPHYKISYAQNFEDLLLAGILKHVERGFYVDVGANHPENDSVTRIFYDKGWSGVNIEPSPALLALLQAHRPRDINLGIGLSSQAGRLSFRSYPDVDGHSTFARDTKGLIASHAPGTRFVDSEIEVRSLSDVLHEHRPAGDIHFLKLDVEGLELEVLLGNDWRRFRPWVLCIERNLDGPRQQSIMAFLAAWNYRAVFFDGINDIVVPAERMDLWHGFSYAGDVVLHGVPVNRIFVPTPRALDELLVLEGQAFVDHAYATLLQRAPDPSGRAFYLAELGRGVAKTEILQALSSSDEGRACKVELPGLRELTQRQSRPPRHFLKRLLRG
jgi:FkbM family methyltransferase